MLATLLLSQGVPMMVAGDEMAAQPGPATNNAYCQDNEISWIDWYAAGRPARRDLHRPSSGRPCACAGDHIVFHRSRFFHGAPIPGTEVKDVTWLRPDRPRKWEGDELRWSATPRAAGRADVRRGRPDARHRNAGVP